jgi:hypothetical protein
MKNYRMVFACLTLLTLTLRHALVAEQLPQDRPTANVAGNWVI